MIVICHSERSEESLGQARFFAALRMTLTILTGNVHQGKAEGTFSMRCNKYGKGSNDSSRPVAAVLLCHYFSNTPFSCYLQYGREIRKEDRKCKIYVNYREP